MTAEYHNITAEQENLGVLEPAIQPAKGMEFYISHKPVVGKGDQSTKTCIVHDVSARANLDVPSLNKCLIPGLHFRTSFGMYLYISVHTNSCNREHQEGIPPDSHQGGRQRHSLRFHWRKNEHSELETLRFARALFRLAPSPFLLGGVLECKKL